MTALRIIFMGTPAFALPTLEALIASYHHVCAVYCQPPRPAGRGQKLTHCPVALYAKRHALPVYHPETLKTAEAQTEFMAHHADIAIVAAYGLLLPKAILEAPRLGCINIHPSALPRWRGAAPIQRTIMAGDETTECCVMQMEQGLDTGAVFARQAVAIYQEMDAGQLHDIMAALGAKMTLSLLEDLISGKAHATAQTSEGVSYATKITKEDVKIHWSDTASSIHNKVRGLAPSPSAQFSLGPDIIKLCKSRVDEQSHTSPIGTLLDDNGLVACAHGTTLRLLELQRAGKSRMPFSQFVHGYPLLTGMGLS